MTTIFQTLLKKHAVASAYDDTEDYFFGHVDCFLSAAAKAIIADGLPREKVMRLLISHAFEIMRFDRPVREWKQAEDTILQTVLARLSDGDSRKAS